ncbi:MAG: CBS domain-containing protein [Candidatus Omnitrophica bacterium]|nr:CBS domain-containing protein [Candidatus Omnitrophota bacterium]
MQRRQCGFLPIVESRTVRRVIGVVTDRDIALHLTRTNQPADQVPVASCMSREPKAVSPDAELEEAAALMEKHAIHRLPVVENDQVVGVLSLKDIARAARKEWAGTGPRRAEQQMVDIIEAIAAVRAPAEQVRRSGRIQK